MILVLYIVDIIISIAVYPNVRCINKSMYLYRNPISYIYIDVLVTTVY